MFNWRDRMVLPLLGITLSRSRQCRAGTATGCQNYHSTICGSQSEGLRRRAKIQLYGEGSWPGFHNIQNLPDNHDRRFTVPASNCHGRQAAFFWAGSRGVEKKEKNAAAQRRSQSPGQRAARIADFEKERHRDQAMLSQLTRAFDFKLIGTRAEKRGRVWVLKATPKPGYQPPDMETQVLPGMEGELWIDQATYEWVKVTAEVIRTVSIEGFLARVEPGTRALQ